MNAVTEIKPQDRPFSERYRIIAKKWVESKAKAVLIKEMKSHELAKRKASYRTENPDDPGSDAFLERAVFASEEWAKYIRGMVDAQKEADEHQKHLQVIEMEFEEWRSLNAKARKERKMY